MNKYYLDQDGLNKLWEKLDVQNTEIVNRIKKLQESYPIYYNTVEGWEEDKSLASEKGTVYIYSDREVNGKIVPGIKIGNGAILADLPFIDIDYIEHIANTKIHITDEERTTWNNKIDIDVNNNDEELVFIRTQR